MEEVQPDCGCEDLEGEFRSWLKGVGGVSAVAPQVLTSAEGWERLLESLVLWQRSFKVFLFLLGDMEATSL